MSIKFLEVQRSMKDFSKSLLIEPGIVLIVLSAFTNSFICSADVGYLKNISDKICELDYIEKKRVDDFKNLLIELLGISIPF